MWSTGRMSLEPVTPARRPRRIGWVVLIVITVAVLLGARAIGLPSPEILAGMVGGIVMALSGRGPVAVPGPANLVAQAAIGVALGSMVTSKELQSLANDWLGVLVVTVVTLVISFGSGFLLALHPAVDRVTGVLSMAAGGASGLVAVANDLGGDVRIVGILQYTRVLLITATTPMIAAYVFGAPSGAAVPSTDDPAGGSLVGLGCMVLGIGLARLARLPAGDMLGPMVVAAAVSIWGGVPTPTLPPLLAAAAYVVIGWIATLGFTRQSIGLVTRILPLALGLTLGLIAITAVSGLWLAHLVGLPALDGYLATTPGGMFAVLAVAAGSGSNVTFITGVQAIRLFLMLGLTPLLTGWLSRGQG